MTNYENSTEMINRLIEGTKVELSIAEADYKEAVQEMELKSNAVQFLNERLKELIAASDYILNITEED
jgi:hypothetical protein